MIINITAVLFQLDKSVSGFTVSVFETIIIFFTTGVLDHMCEKAKVISEGKKSILMNSEPAFFIKI